jgi:long-chain acyl-CoA synthetase
MKTASGTLPAMFQKSVTRFPDTPALMGKVKGVYRSKTYRQMAQEVREVAKGLISLGVKSKDHVALLSENRPEWATSDMALAHIGAVNVASFPNIPASQVEYIISDSGSRLIVVSPTQLKKALEIRDRNTKLRIIAMNTPPNDATDIMTLDEVKRLGDHSPESDNEFERRVQETLPGDWASIIYTSGTTGNPKGVVLSHYNFVSNVEAAREVLHFQPGEILLSFVPLNHVMGRLADNYLPLSTGSTIAYVESLLRLRQNLQEVKPHYMLLVPRVLEIFHDSLLANISKEPAKRQRIFNWALSVGKECCDQMAKRWGVSFPKSVLWSVADLLVYRKIRSRLGIQRLKFFFSGGAPLPHQTAEFFCALRINIMEGYGLSETSPLVTVNPSGLLKYGTVGRPVRGVKVKLDDSGEILVRGPNVMQGYYNKPLDTAEAIDEDGWLHTGDIGQFDEDGYLRITDRKKNLIVLTNGKKVAPQPIENRLTESPYITHAIVLGDKRSTVAALLVPAYERIKDWVSSNGFAIDLDDKAALATHPEVVLLMKNEIERLLPDLADFEKIRKFSILSEELNIDNGSLTPTLKVKRDVLMERYKDVIDEMYR